MTNQDSNKIYLFGAVLLFFALSLAGLYLFIKSNILRSENDSEVQEISKQQPSHLTYSNDQFAYSVEYRSDLTPSEVESSNYLNFVIFAAPLESEKSGFGLSVRENSLQQEIEVIKEEISNDIEAKLVEENEEELLSYQGYRLTYEPVDKTEGETKTLVIVNNGQFSYTISSTPEQIDSILSGFKLF